MHGEALLEGAEDGLSDIQRWKKEAAFYEAELRQKSQIWEEREQALINEVDMRDSELNALEHRVRKAAMDVEASESARTEAVTKAQHLAARAEELEQSLFHMETQQADPAKRRSTESKETDRLRARALRAEEHVMQLGEMLAGVCRQESQLVALLTSAREQLRQLGCSEDAIGATSAKSKNGQSPRQPLAISKSSSTSSLRVASQQMHLNMQAQQQVRSRLVAREHLVDAAQEAAAIEHELEKLQGSAWSSKATRPLARATFPGHKYQ